VFLAWQPSAQASPEINHSAQSAAGQASSQNQKAAVVVLGDSLSAAYNMPQQSGWVALLRDRLNEQLADAQWQVVNASISGETSGGGASRIEGLLSQHQPRVLILELGGNDGLRGLSLKQFRANLEKIIQLSRNQNVNVLLAGIQIPTNYGAVYRRRFEAVYTDLAESYQLSMIPFLLEHVADKPELMQGDGIHPNAQGQPQILTNVWPYLEPLLNEPMN